MLISRVGTQLRAGPCRAPCAGSSRPSSLQRSDEHFAVVAEFDVDAVERPAVGDDARARFGQSVGGNRNQPRNDDTRRAGYAGWVDCLVLTLTNGMVGELSPDSVRGVPAQQR